MQLGLPGFDAGGPAGFVYQPDLLAPAEEDALLARVRPLELGEFVMHGVAARRQVRMYGWDYATGRRVLTPGEPIPAFLLPLRERCAALSGLPPDRLEMALVIRYPPGAGIGWHRDAPQFGRVVGVSLGAPCRMRLRRGPGRPSTEVVLAPRSGYALAGAARWAWQHHIPPVKAERYSVTFRSLKRDRS
ncbi:MAG TPA: alpha-ketoglutarate-dependent dioxygenase AlkB [Anaeromyxobacteraceae bacterium]|nr:alpha-ketoglutarate-dependent dioxygenase AlkB [Anaeromyxobacteraceae bacterium]